MVANGKIWDVAKFTVTVIVPLISLTLVAIILPGVRWTHSEIVKAKDRDALFAERMAKIETRELQLATVLERVARLEADVAVINANRFTSEDAVQMYEVIATKADKVGVPPPIVTRFMETSDRRYEQLNRDIKHNRELLEQLLGRLP